MKRSFFPFILLFCFALNSSAQKLSRQEGLFINRCIDEYLSKTDYVYDKPRKSEFILLLITIDSVGSPSSINLLSDEQNRDTTYTLLKMLTPAVFKNKQFKGCSGKVIAVPIISIVNEINSTYVRKMYQVGDETISAQKGYILNRPYFYRVVENEYQKKE
jgi:hypothetical protein